MFPCTRFILTTKGGPCFPDVDRRADVTDLQVRDGSLNLVEGGRRNGLILYEFPWREQDVAILKNLHLKMASSGPTDRKTIFAVEVGNIFFFSYWWHLGSFVGFPTI
jgi:hypothetical protein